MRPRHARTRPNQQLQKGQNRQRKRPFGSHERGIPFAPDKSQERAENSRAHAEGEPAPKLRFIGQSGAARWHIGQEGRGIHGSRWAMAFHDEAAPGPRRLKSNGIVVFGSSALPLLCARSSMRPARSSMRLTALSFRGGWASDGCQGSRNLLAVSFNNARSSR